MFQDLSSGIRKTEGYIEFLLKVRAQHSIIADIDDHFCMAVIDELSVHNGLIKSFIINMLSNSVEEKSAEPRLDTKTETEWVFLNNESLGVETDFEARKFLLLLERVRRFADSDNGHDLNESRLDRVLILSYLVYSGQFSVIKEINFPGK